MHLEKRKASDQPDLVSSFKTAFVGSADAIDSVCIKFATYSGGERLSYWRSKWLMSLYQCVEYYRQLPSRHTVRTMINESPELTERDYLAATQDFAEAALEVVDQSDACCIQCTFANGDRRTEMLPAYIAMNLCASLRARFDLHGLIAQQPRGPS
jgi:hypothetical protein